MFLALAVLVLSVLLSQRTDFTLSYVPELSDWNYVRDVTLTFDSTHSMPVVVVVPLPDDDAFWSHIKPDGSDIRVTVGTGLSERILPSMLVDFDYSRHRGKVAVLTDVPSTTMTFRLYYGNPNAEPLEPFAIYHSGKFYAFRKDLDPSHWTVYRATGDTDNECYFKGTSHVYIARGKDKACAMKYYKEVPYAEGKLYVRLGSKHDGADGVVLWLFRDVPEDFVPGAGYWLGFNDVNELTYHAADDDHNPDTRDASCDSNPVYVYYYVHDPDGSSHGEEPEGWYLPSFDDSNWETGYAPFGGFGGACTSVLTSAPDDLFVRRWFEVPGVPVRVVLRLATDDGVRCYVNGHLVLDKLTDDHGPSYWNYEVKIPVDYLHEGSNLLACWVANGGENSGSAKGYFDAEIFIQYDRTSGYGVEIDNYKNSELGDPYNDHIALIKDSVANHIVAKSYTSDTTNLYVEFKDDKYSVKYNNHYLVEDQPLPERRSFPLVVSAATGGVSGDYRLYDFYFMYTKVSPDVEYSPERLPPRAPNIVVESPVQGTVYDTNKVHVDVYVTDPNADMDSVVVSLDGNVLVSRSVSESFVFVSDIELNDGQHSLDVNAVDLEGITSHVVVPFIVDTEPPVLEINNVSYDGNYLTFEINATDLTLYRCYYITDVGSDKVDIPCEGNVSIPVSPGTRLFVVAEDRADHVSVAYLETGQTQQPGSGGTGAGTSGYSGGGGVSHGARVVSTSTGTSSDLNEIVSQHVQQASPSPMLSTSPWLVVALLVLFALFVVLGRR